jgi:hypothetical protein
MHSAIFEVEESLNAIEFYQHHPEYKPFVGNNFDKYRILQVGESHYIGQGAKDRMDEFPITYFDKWWEDPCVKLCEWPDPNPKEGKWGDWYNTRGVVENFIANRSTGGYNIFANMIRSFDCVYGNGQVYMDVDARQRYHYFAFMNFFKMPALYNGVKFWDSLYISAKKIGDTSLAGNMFDLAAKKSAEVLDQVIETIKPNAIVISSREAATAYEKYGKYRGNEVGPAIIHTVHPCCSWWNRKIRRYNGRTGREYFEDELRALHLK